MGFTEWLRYQQEKGLVDAVENPDPECDAIDAEDESADPASAYYISPEEKVRMYQHAKREMSIMEKFGFDDIHKQFPGNPYK